MTDRRVITIEGQQVAVFERLLPVPPTLDLLLEGGRDEAGRWHLPLRVSRRFPLVLRGARAACADQDHRLFVWLEGLHRGLDGETRSLRLEACADCGAVCIRDRSFDLLTGLPPGAQPLRQRDHVLGWYSGARPRQRIYT